MGQSHRDEGLQGTVPGHGDTGYTVGLVLSTTISQVNSIKCYMDNQGIPVAEEPYIIPEFKEFDCSLGGGKHKNCMKYTKEYDGEMLIYRNCGVLEEKSGCKTDALLLLYGLLQQGHLQQVHLVPALHPGLPHL